MKKILITGANSYIGISFENYMKQYDGYEIDTIDMTDDNWRNKNFESYDVVFHVAGIAHSDTGTATEEQKALYYKINTDLTVETAQKAKNDGVGQFIFMSSIIVYGSKNECITIDTKPAPDNFYGESKLKADIEIHKLEDKDFKVVSIRSPMIYGKGSKGNYPKISKLARITPVFPDYDNKRSMLYIGNLCEFIRLIINNEDCGYFYPQNKEYVKTSYLVKGIANTYGKKIFLTKLLNLFIALLKHNSLINKVFGNLFYAKEMSSYDDFSYCVFDFHQSLELTEK